MKINPSSVNALVNGKDAGKPQESSTAKGAAQPKPGGDRVALSPLAAEIAALESKLVAEPGFDRARVEAIKQAISEGRLTVNADVVADKMIASALALLASRPQ